MFGPYRLQLVESLTFRIVPQSAEHDATKLQEHGLRRDTKEEHRGEMAARLKAAETLRLHTGNAGKVLKWSGPLDPYPTYAIGTIAKDAYADILLWDGNPLEDINLILDEDKLDLIMKDGKIYKNRL